jgi:GNAT superfamily N-acetyltransferase
MADGLGSGMRRGLSLVFWTDIVRGWHSTKHSGSQAGAHEMISFPRYGFRRFTEADLPAVQHLHVTALHSTNAFIEVDDFYADLDDIPGTYLKAGGEFLVGEIDAQIIAMGGLQLHDNAVGELRRMRVAPHVQGKGIGRALLHQLETVAFARGCRRIKLDTTVNQSAAQRLFVSCGYLELGRGNKSGQLETIFYSKST